MVRSEGRRGGGDKPACRGPTNRAMNVVWRCRELARSSARQTEIGAAAAADSEEHNGYFLYG
jgi:hypothetical protein